MKRRRPANAATILVTAGLLACALGAMPLQTAASNPGPPIYVPPEPSVDDGDWVREDSGQDEPENPGENGQPIESAPDALPQESIPESAPETTADAVQSQPAAQSNASFSQFKQAVLGEQSTVHLEGNITMEEAIALPAGRHVTIEGGGYTIREGAAGHTIQVGDGSSVTLRNVVVEGYDANGIVNCTAGTDVVISFEGVRYTGPQLCRNAAAGDSRIRIQDCEITLSETLVQGSWVEFAGNTTVTQTGADHPIFHLDTGAREEADYGGCDRGIIVTGGARVSMESAGYMMLGSMGAFVAQESSYFSCTSADGGNYGTENGFAWLDIEAGANFLFEQSGAGGYNDNPALTVAQGGTFRLGQDSVFSAQIHDAVDSAALDFRGDCTVQITSPQRMLVAGGSQAVTTGDSATTWQVSGVSALNFYDGQGGRYIWNDHADELPPFSFQVMGDGSLHGVPGTVKDLRGMPLTQSDDSLYSANMRRIAMGTFSGSLAVESWEGPISGFAAAGAELTAAFFGADGAEHFAVTGLADGEPQSDGNNRYSIALPQGDAPANTELGVVAAQDGLLVQRIASVERVEGGGVRVLGGNASLWVNAAQTQEGRVETNLRVTDTAARGWRIVASNADSGEPATIQIPRSAGVQEEGKVETLDRRGVLLWENAAGESDTLLFAELYLPKAEDETSPKKVRWTMILPVD